MPKKFRKLLILTFSALLLAFVSLQLMVYFWIRPVFNAIFQESVSHYSSGLYAVQYDDMQIRPLKQSIRFRNFQLTFDSSRVKQEAPLRQKKWVALALDEFELSLDNFWTMIPDRYLKVNSLSIDRPRLSIYDFGEQQAPQSLNLEKLSRFDAHALISEYFDSLDVESLNISRAQLSWINRQQPEPLVLGGIGARVGKLRIDSNTVNQNYGYPHAEQFEIQVRDVAFFTPDSLYAFQLGEVSADPVNRQMKVKGFSMSPQKPVYQFARSVGHQLERIQLSVEELSLNNIDLHYLLTEQAFLVGNIRINKPVLEVFKDKRLAATAVSVKPLLQEALLQVPVAFRLDTLQLREGSIQYREHVDQALASGGIYFDKLFVSGYNITNLDSLRKDELLMEVDVETYFMGESLLKISLDVPLDDKRGLHRITGEMYDLPLPSLNNMLENTAFASVKSGFAYTLKFDMQLDEQQAEGDLHFAYRDLKISLLNKEDPGQSGLKESIKSLMANWVIVKTNNPDNNRKPLRIGEISFQREADKSIFNYWWKSLLTGIKGSVGMGEHHSSADGRDAEKEKPGLLKRIFGREKSGK